MRRSIMARARWCRGRSKVRSTPRITRQSVSAPSRSPSVSNATASSSATGRRRLRGTPGGISKPGTAFSVSAPSITPSIHVCSPSRSPGLSTMPKTGSCLPTSPSCRSWKSLRPDFRRSSATSCSPTPPTCRRRACAMPSPMRNGSPRPTAISPGDGSMRTPPPACATPPAPPAIPRACSIRTAPMCCTR